MQNKISSEKDDTMRVESDAHTNTHTHTEVYTQGTVRQERGGWVYLRKTGPFSVKRLSTTQVARR